MTIYLIIGRFGGFYVARSESSIRICIGWIALTISCFDADEKVKELIRKSNN